MGARAEIDEALLRQLLINDTKVWTALKRAGDDAVEFWKSKAPETDVKEHKLMAQKGFIVHPGDYEQAVRARMMRAKTGEPFVRVQDWDPKANWLEYGSVHNPEPTAPCAQTRAYMQSKGFGG